MELIPKTFEKQSGSWGMDQFTLPFIAPAFIELWNICLVCERERERGVYIKGTLISMFLSLRLLKPKALKGVRERQRLQTSRMNERGGKA